jgi:flagellar basal-body rod protein FlgG
MRAMSIAATGMSAQELNVQVISNNIANMNTTGFKRQRAEFQDLLYTSMDQVGAQTSAQGTIAPTGVQIGTGVKAGSVYRITEQGALTQTGNTYDLAITGRGYFKVNLPSGEDAYTRAGNFSINAEGQIVTEDGYTVSPGITVPAEATAVKIDGTGQVQAIVPGATEAQVVGQLELATFVNPTGLDAQGDNLFKETAASGAATIGTPGSTGFGQLQQGFVEASNVNAVTEISSLIIAQRAYEMNSKVISAADDMMSTTAQIAR